MHFVPDIFMQNCKGKLMKLIVCVDNRGGMLFNKRRVSSDRVVTERIQRLCSGDTLVVSSYTYKLFESKENIISAEEPLTVAGERWCFIEECDVSRFLRQAEKIVIFFWNRTYPADLQFPLEQVRNGWQLTHSEEFAGHSHQRITMEVYDR